MFINENVHYKTKISIAYLLAVILVVVGQYDKCSVLAVLVVSLFLCEEYFNRDVKKVEVLKIIRFKLADFCILYGLIYKIAYPILAVILYDKLIVNICFLLGIREPNVSVYSTVFAFGLTLIGIHRLYSERIKLYGYKEVIAKLSRRSYYDFRELLENDREERVIKRLRLVCEIEDRHYFDRKGYTIIGNVFIKGIYKGKSIDQIGQKAYSAVKNIRGYSTIEMQLLRILFFERGLTFNRKPGKRKFRRYREIIFRKLFELVISPCFFKSYKNYIQETITNDIEHYKEFVLYQYLHTVQTLVNGNRYYPLSDLFKNIDEKTTLSIEEWKLETLFLAVLGLSNRCDKDNIDVYQNVARRYGLIKEKLYELIV